MRRGKSRYGNIKKHVHPDGTILDSKRELKRYCELLLLKRAGKISQLRVHVRYPIILGGIKVLMKSKRYPNGRQMVYCADFSYLDHSNCCQRPVIEDCKMQSGHRTEVYKIKKALMQAMGYEILET